MIAKTLVVSGRVQGVGFRDWIITRARRLGLAGWVRNRRDGTLEALERRGISACLSQRPAGRRCHRDHRRFRRTPRRTRLRQAPDVLAHRF